MNYIENKGTMDPKALNQWKFVPEKWTVPAANVIISFYSEIVNK